MNSWADYIDTISIHIYIIRLNHLVTDSYIQSSEFLLLKQFKQSFIYDFSSLKI